METPELPAPAVAEVSPEGTSAAGASASRRRVLCVDDELLILSGIQRQLRKQFDIAGALGGPQGLKTIAEKAPFSVIVSDFQMPGMSGLEFLKRARELTPDSVCIILSGKADMNVAIQALNQGLIFRFLTKPCPAEVLAEGILAAADYHDLTVSRRAVVDRSEEGVRESLTNLEERVRAARTNGATDSQQPARAVSNTDPVTGLPDRSEAEAAIRAGQQAGADYYVVGFVLEKTDHIINRYGSEVLNQLLITASQRIALWLGPGSTLFRWSGPCFVALVSSEKKDVALRNELQAATATWQSEYVENRSHSVYLPIKITVLVSDLNTPVGLPEPDAVSQ